MNIPIRSNSDVPINMVMFFLIRLWAQSFTYLMEDLRPKKYAVFLDLSDEIMIRYICDFDWNGNTNTIDGIFLRA